LRESLLAQDSPKFDGFVYAIQVQI